MRKFILTLFYSGLSPIAKGTAGSIVALFLGVLILQFFPPSTLFLGAILVFVATLKEIDKYELETNSKDPQEIVIDELIGMWIALALSGGTTIQIILSFIFFRFFDIKKPSIIGKAQNLKGGLGVNLDDAIAGIFAGLLSAVVYHLLKTVGMI